MPVVRTPIHEDEALSSDKVDLILSDFGLFLGKKSERLVVRKGGETQQEVPLFKLQQVIVASTGVSLSADVVKECADRGIPIYFLSSSGRPYATVLSAGLIGTVATRREQLLAYTDERGIHLAKAFARGKIRNQANFLRYQGKYRKTRQADVYRKLDDAARQILELDRAVDEAEGDDIEAIRPVLLNLEARSAILYWDCLRTTLPQEIPFDTREKRGAEDLVNSCLNYGYGVLYTQIESALVLAGLDPYAGFLHADRSGRPSMVMDLIEEFRQPVVDRTVFGLLNLKVKLEVADGRLTDETRRTVASKVLERLDGLERYDGKKHRLRTIIQRQARAIASFVRGEGRYDPFVASW
jgi:CRISPR-associated protein Cas1